MLCCVEMLGHYPCSSTFDVVIDSYPKLLVQVDAHVHVYIHISFNGHLVVLTT